jgi:hypothetical protein
MASAAEEDNSRRPRAAFFSPARLIGERGVALARLQRPQAAQQVLESALASLDPEVITTRPRLMAAPGHRPCPAGQHRRGLSSRERGPGPGRSTAGRTEPPGRTPAPYGAGALAQDASGQGAGRPARPCRVGACFTKADASARSVLRNAAQTQAGHTGS